MGLSKEMTKRILDLYGDNEEVRELVATGDINTLWVYVSFEASKWNYLFLNPLDIVQACETKNSAKLAQIYSLASSKLNDCSANEKTFLTEIVEAFKNNDLEGIYAKAKRTEKVLILCGSLTTLLLEAKAIEETIEKPRI